MSGQTDSGRLPLKSAYRFMQTRGLASEVEAIRKSQGRLHSYNSTIRRGRLIVALQRHGLFDQFIVSEWPKGLTKEGRREIQTCMRIYKRFLDQVPLSEDASTSAEAGFAKTPGQSPRNPLKALGIAPEVEAPFIAQVIRANEPFSNLVKLRQLLRRAVRYVWWADRYFNARGLEELAVAVNPGIVQEIRILSGDDRIDDRTRRDFERFRREMSEKGVSADWRILKGFSHDRFLVSAAYCANVPSVDTILTGNYSEILETPNAPPFEEWWSRANPLLQKEA